MGALTNTQRTISRLETRAARREVKEKAVRSQRLSPQVRLEAKAAYLSGRYATMPELAKRMGVSTDTLHKWRKEEDWDKDMQAIEVRTKVRINENIEELLEIMKGRHLETAKELQEKGIAALRTLEPTDVNQARLLVESGVKMERQALGADEETKNPMSGLLSGEIIAAAIQSQKIVVVRKTK